MTPIKLNALVKVHIKINAPDGEDGAGNTTSKTKQGYIDQIF